MPDDILDRYRGCMLGLALGDALGTAVEFCKPGSFEPLTDIVGGGPFRLLAGQWTDDTAMALCLAESLLRCEGADDANDQLATFSRWMDDAHNASNVRCFDIGTTTRAALMRFKGQAHKAPEGEGRNAGNGSLMRLAPMALLTALDAEHAGAISQCGQSSVTTHDDPRAVDACRYMGALLVGALRGDSKEALLSPLYTPPGAGADLWQGDNALCAEVDTVAQGSFRSKGGPPQVCGGAFAPTSLEAALWAFASSTTFEQGALLVANLGDDADTTAAIYGQLAGAHYGAAALPPAWLAKLVHKPLLRAAADGLHELAAARATAAASSAPAPSEGAAVEVLPRTRFAFTSTVGASGDDRGGGSSGGGGVALRKFALLAEANATIEDGYRAVLRKLSPGPGPPMAWPGGFADVAALESATTAVAAAARDELARLVALPAAAAAAMPPTEGLSEELEELLVDHGRQWADDAQKLGAALARRPAVGMMLGQIKAKRVEDRGRVEADP